MIRAEDEALCCKRISHKVFFSIIQFYMRIRPHCKAEAPVGASTIYIDNKVKSNVCRDGMKLLLQKVRKRKAWWQDCPLAADKWVQFDFFNASAHSLAVYCPKEMPPSISLAPFLRGLVRVVPLLVFRHVPFFLFDS